MVVRLPSRFLPKSQTIHTFSCTDQTCLGDAEFLSAVLIPRLWWNTSWVIRGSGTCLLEWLVNKGTGFQLDL